MFRVLFAIVFSLVGVSCPIAAFPQQQKIDSLRHRIEGRSGIEKYDAMIDLIRFLGSMGWNREATDLIHAARKMAYDEGDTARIVQSSRILAQMYNRLSMSNEAKPILLQMLPIAERHNFREDYGRILGNLGLVYVYQGNYDLALEYNLKALRIREVDNDLVNLAVSLWDIGLVYYKLKDYNKGLSYFKKSQELKRKIGDYEEMDELLVNIGLCHAYIGNFDTAKNYVDSSLSMSKDSVLNVELVINAHFCLGVIHFGLGKMKSAESEFLISYGLAKKYGNVRFQFDDIDYLSQIYIQQNQIDRAIHYLKTAETLIDQGAPFNLESVKIYAQFSQVYNQRKDFEMAALYQQKYIQLKDSLYSEALTNNLMKLEAEYQEKENKAKISAQEQILGLKERIILQQTASNIIFGCIAIMLVFVAGILYHRNRQKRMVNKILNKKVQERTAELESEREALAFADKEMNQSVESMIIEIKNSLSVIMSLCTCGLQEISDPSAQEYFRKVNLTSEQLGFTLTSLQTPATHFDISD